MSTVLESALTPEQRAQANAADAAADQWAKARQIDLPAATAAHTALHKALQVRAPRFAQTYCSQCGREQGPGDSGVSSCADHMHKQAAARQPHCTQGTSYVEFRSSYLDHWVRVGYPSQSEDAELTEVWIGGADLGQHLVQGAADALEAELHAHLLARAS